jgi:hypothetical protein
MSIQFENEIRAYMSAHGLDVPAMAKKMGISQSVLYKYLGWRLHVPDVVWLALKYWQLMDTIPAPMDSIPAINNRIKSPYP